MMVAGVTYQLAQETRIPKTRDRIEMKIMEGKLSKRISIQMRWNFRAGYFIFYRGRYVSNYSKLVHDNVNFRDL